MGCVSDTYKNFLLVDLPPGGRSQLVAIRLGFEWSWLEVSVHFATQRARRKLLISKCIFYCYNRFITLFYSFKHDGNVIFIYWAGLDSNQRNMT